MPNLLRVFRAVLPILPAACAVLLATACKTERTVGELRQEPDPIRQRFAGNYELVKDENGMVSVKSDRRSQFESKIYTSSGRAKMEKDYKVAGYTTKDYKAKGFSGEKSYKTKDAKEDTEQSKWNWPWKDRTSSPRDSGKSFDTGGGYDTGEDYGTSAFKDNDRSFATSDDPYAAKRRNYNDSALDNIRSPGAGEGGPSVRDVRGLLGKDD